MFAGLGHQGMAPCFSHGTSCDLRNRSGCNLIAPIYNNNVRDHSVPSLSVRTLEKKGEAHIIPSCSFFLPNDAQSLAPAQKVHGACSPQNVKCQRLLLTFKPQPSLCEVEGSGRVGHSARTIGSLSWQRLFTRYQSVSLQSSSCRQARLTVAVP